MIELSQGFENEYDNILNFYLDRMDDSILSGGLDLQRFARIQKIAANQGHQLVKKVALAHP
ncbi:MAG: hypothetical protein AAF518_11145 [Spirochaetota bacterium]